jgi:OOP family OmpA-OmpF porin
MKSSRVIAAVVLVLSGLFAASQASAQGFYVGGSVGKSDIDDEVASGLITAGSVDGSDTGLKIFGGYQFNQNFGLEVAYVDLGEASYSGTFSGLPVTGGKVEISGLNVSAVGTFPVSPSFAVFGKVGLFAWDAEASDVTGGVPFSASDDGTDISYGIGVSYNFTKNLSARAEWEAFKTDPADASLLSIGLAFKF